MSENTGSLYLYGIPVVLSEAIIDGYKQHRTHKRHRINKKWLKRYGRTAIPSKSIFSTVSPRKVYAHPSTWSKIENELRVRGMVKTHRE